MKRSNFIFESVLMVISLLLGIACIFSDDAFFLAILWLIPLGALQVIHALILTVNYWTNSAIKKLLIVYWVGVVLNFSIMLISDNLPGKDWEMLTIGVLPLMLAFFLWLITFIYKDNPAQKKQLILDNKEKDIVL